MKKIVSFALAVVFVLGAVSFVPAEAGGVFRDVPEGAWFYSAVTAVWKAGIMNGTAADKFSPRRLLTGSTVS